MTELLPTAEHSTYFRDPKSRAVLNTDLEGLKMYKEKRKQSLEVRSLRKDVDSIRKDMVELKIMVRQVMERLND